MRAVPLCVAHTGVGEVPWVLDQHLTGCVPGLSAQLCTAVYLVWTW